MLTCPYCNAFVEAAPGTLAGARAVCARCGESFVLRESIAESPSGAANVSVAPPVMVARPTRALYLTVAAILGVMCVCAGIGLWFALSTQGYRRGNDAAITKRFKRTSLRQGVVEPPLPAVTAPARLDTLGYLPSECNLLIGIDPAALKSGSNDTDLLQRPIKLGTSDVRLGELLSSLQLSPKEVEHAVLGLRIEEPLSAVLLIRNRKPIDLERLTRSLQAESIGGSRPVYRFTWPSVKLPAFLTLLDTRTLAVSLVERSLTALPAPPREGVDHLPAPVRSALRERIEPGAAAWLVAHADDWDKTVIPALLGQLLKPDLRERLLRLRTAAVSIRTEDRLSLHAALRARDDQAARTIEEALAKGPEREGVSLKTSVEDDWLTAQYAITPAAWARLLER